MSIKGFFKLVLLLIVPAAMLFMGGCKKEQFGNGPLAFSTDTLTFDTVFATMGSTTKYFKVFNDSKKILKVSDIRLMHLVGNQFRINVDGVKGDHFTDIEIPAEDSIYVFVEVTVNPNDQSNPFVIIDDVVFTSNGTAQTVHLQAWGQNAHFHYGDTIKDTIVNWTNDLPHVIISRGNTPGVFVECGATLNIKPGCKIYFVGNSALFVEGNLYADEGTSWNDSIVFQGARLEHFYDDKPGQWFGLVFLRSNECVAEGRLNYCIVNKSSYSIYVGGAARPELNTVSAFTNSAFSPSVIMDNTIVKNSSSYAIYTFNGKVTANNCLLYTSGDNLTKFTFGGTYEFNHCTFYNGGSRFISHEKEILWLGNAVDSSNVAIVVPLKTKFTNSLIYGSMRNEVSFNNVMDTDLSLFDNQFSYCAIKTNGDTLSMFSTKNDSSLLNTAPLFKKPEAGDFTPADSGGIFSPLIDYCPSIPGLTRDLFDKLRGPYPGKPNIGRPYDVGAVEAGQ